MLEFYIFQDFTPLHHLYFMQTHQTDYDFQIFPFSLNKTKSRIFKVIAQSSLFLRQNVTFDSDYCFKPVDSVTLYFMCSYKEGTLWRMDSV